MNTPARHFGKQGWKTCTFEQCCWIVITNTYYANIYYVYCFLCQYFILTITKLSTHFCYYNLTSCENYNFRMRMIFSIFNLKWFAQITFTAAAWLLIIVLQTYFVWYIPNQLSFHVSANRDKVPNWGKYEILVCNEDSIDINKIICKNGVPC